MCYIYNTVYQFNLTAIKIVFWGPLTHWPLLHLFISRFDKILCIIIHFGGYLILLQYELC